MRLPAQTTTIRLLVLLFVLLALSATVLLVRRRTRQRASEVLATQLTLAGKAGRAIRFTSSPANAA